MPKIVLSFLTRDNDYQLFQAADAQKVATREGLDLELMYADNNAIQQIHQLFRHIHAPAEQRPGVLIVEPVSDDGMERVARNAVEAGIGWVVINRRSAYMSNLRTQRPSMLVSAVRTDQVEVGRIQARQFLILLPRGGQLLYMQGPSHSGAARERLDGMQEGIAGSEIKVTLLDGAWTSESAEKALQAWGRLKSGPSLHVDLVGSQNDAMAIGVRRAFQSHPDPEVRREWSQIPCTGCDGLPEGGQRMVERGELVATVISPSNGGPAVELAARFLRGKGPLPPEVVLQPVSYPSVEELARRRPQPKK